MKKNFCAVVLLAVSRIWAEPVVERYPDHPDSVVRAGVPVGELIKWEFSESKVFPGTTREVTIYVPAQYRDGMEACVFVCQDGVKFNAPVVFDNLIHQGAMPVTIGVFVQPGRVRTAVGEGRYNRSFEYDSMNGNLARFYVDELLPAVEKLKTADGRALRLSRRATDGAMAGASSGGIAAMSVGWARPDRFSRVYCSIGTFAGLRGGDGFPALVRKTEPKALRVFLHDGEADLNNDFGDWWMANQTMERALQFAGYDVGHLWGPGAHNEKHARATFPDAMRWLWKNWPEAPRAGKTQNVFLGDVLLPGEDWKLVGEGYSFTEGPIANAAGEVFFNDIPASKSFKIALDGSVREWTRENGRSNGQAFGPDGRLYVAATGAEKILAYGADGLATTVAEGIAGNDLVIAANGNIYVTQPVPGAGKRSERSKIWLVRPTGEKVLVDEGLKFANGIALSPDQALLYVADFETKWIFSYVVQADGTLAHKQRFGWLHGADLADGSAADGIRMDREGRLWVATNVGIQVQDYMGRTHAIIPTPNGRVANLCFGGPAMDVLYATCGDKVFARRVKAVGLHHWQPPLLGVKPKR